MDELLKALQHLTKTGATELDSEWLSDFVTHWRQLTEAERKAMVQLEEIRSKLISKETELSLLHADINMLAVDRDNKVAEIEGLTSQLNIIRNENEISLKRIQKLELELEDLKAKNIHLSEELLRKADELKCFEEKSSKAEYSSTGELTVKIKEIQGRIQELESERDKLIKDRDVYEKEKEGQIKALQDALDDALEAKIKLQTKYDKELRDMQESNSTLVDDFEWKLRQIEASCKKKLQEKDKQIEETVKEAKQSSIDFTAEKDLLEQERQSIKEQLRQVAHLKAYEAEVTQLRGVTHEQQKSLRSASRQVEQLKLSEKMMQDEVRTLKTLLEKEKTHVQVVTNSAQRRYDLLEDSLQSKIDKQKSDLNAKWEDKLRDECSRLKQDLNKLHSEEKRIAVDVAKLQKEQDLSTAKQGWERNRQELVQEISRLKEEINAKESSYHKELAKATTIIDRDNWELRRRVEKMSNSHMEQIDSLKESHTEEMDLLRTRYENALSQIEKLQKRLDEYEKTSRSSDSVETEKDSGFVAGGSSQSIVDHTNNDDSECSSEEESEVEESEVEEEAEESYEEEEEEEDEEEVEKTKAEVNVEDNSNPAENSIDDLREEVASLQDSIQTLTLNLVHHAGESKEEDVPKDTPALIGNQGDNIESAISETENSSSMRSAESSVMSSDAESDSDSGPELNN